MTDFNFIDIQNNIRINFIKEIQKEKNKRLVKKCIKAERQQTALNWINDLIQKTAKWIKELNNTIFKHEEDDKHKEQKKYKQ